MTWLRAVRHVTLLAAICLIAGALFPAFGSAFGIEPGGVRVQALDSEGNPDNRAGAHPDRLLIDVDLAPDDEFGPRDLRFDFPAGMAGSPIATPTCSRATFEIDFCPANTKVGQFTLVVVGGFTLGIDVYNVTPAPGQFMALAFKEFWQTEIEMYVDSKSSALVLDTKDLAEVPLEELHIEIWGVPADHNGSAPLARAPFITTPPECGPMKVNVTANSWEVGSPTLSETGESEPLTSCNDLRFEPGLDLHLTNPKPDSPTGARIDVNLNQHTGPDELVNTNLKDARIDLPPGLTVSPGGAEGREFCEDAQFGLGQETPVTCPFRSRVGSIKMASTQLADDLEGTIYLGRERPGERFRLLVLTTAPGIALKSTAKLITDPQTGQISILLSDLPQFPVDQISMDLDGGARALLATPLSCGRATARAHFSPYSGAGATDSSTSVDVGTCGSAPFATGLSAGTSDLSAGHSTDFSFTFTRQEGEQLLKRYAATLPLGLSPNLTAVDTCRSAAAAVGACPDSSKLGTAVAEVGSGPSPAKLPGTVYLTDSFEGAPFGLAMKFKAGIGPFDLGTLNAQASIRIDPRTAQVTIGQVLPTVFEGVPLRFRTLGVDLPRSGFLVNPTSCEPQKVSAITTSVDGRTASPSVPFNVRGCEDLGFRPKFSVALDRRGRHAKKPELSFVVKVPKGQANMDSVKVKFAKILKFHNAALKEICARGDAAEDRCRPGARVGTAVADSPVLGTPLRGPLYVVQPKGGGFPDLWGNIEGRGVKLQLRSESSGKKGNLTSEVVEIPDLPLGTFTMRINGGTDKDAFFTVDKDPCGSPGALTTAADLESQNGIVRTVDAQMKAGCSKSAGKKRSSSKGRAPHRK